MTDQSSILDKIGHSKNTFRHLEHFWLNGDLLTAVKRSVWKGLRSCVYCLTSTLLSVSGILHKVAHLGCLGSRKRWPPSGLTVFYSWNLRFNGKETQITFRTMTVTIIKKGLKKILIEITLCKAFQVQQRLITERLQNFIIQPNTQLFLFYCNVSFLFIFWFLVVFV